MRFNQSLKDMIDPNYILALRRCGIWPKGYRGKGRVMASADDASTGNDVLKSNLWALRPEFAVFQ